MFDDATTVFETDAAARLMHYWEQAQAVAARQARAALCAPVSALATRLAEGGAVILCDDESRENEGDLVVAARHATPRMVNFFLREGRGLVCVALNAALAARFGLPMMTEKNLCARGTAFTVSVDAARGIGTGISARDRSRTIRLLADPQSTAADFVSPGHVFPLIADPGGLHARRGHTEAGVYLAQLAGLGSAAVICEILDDDGEPMRRPALQRFAARHRLLMGTVEDLAAHAAAMSGPN